MADTVVSYRFLVRGGTAANLALVNEIPKSRELVIETDTRKLKVGNGVARFNDLPYISGGNTEMRVNATHIQWSNDGVTWFNLIAISELKGKDGREVQLQVSSAGLLQWRYVGTTAWTTLMDLMALKGEPGPAGAAGPPGPSSSTFPTASFDGGLGDIIVGSFCDLYVPFGFDISKATLVGDAVGILEVDVRVAPYASFPPSSLDTICAGTRPRLLSTIKSQDAALTDWTKAIASGSFIRFVITACTGIKRANLVLEGART